MKKIMNTEEMIMKVLILNGSPHETGNTTLALREMITVFEAEGIEVDYVQVGHLSIKGCTGCAACFKIGKCVTDDIVNELSTKFQACDGMVIASPVYYASANGTLISLLDRLFYSTRIDKRMKVGASVAVARRGGCSATFDQLNKYFTISGMPVASSQYWNSVHGALPGQAAEDGEGLQTMRTLARNMTFLMKSIALGKEAYGLPEKEKSVWTNFVR
jgi:multimeric flavodoxin WrbA